MGDRQDIDALLMGAVYGELSTSEQAQLDSHLAAHPQDRAAIDALVRTRATVRSSLTAMPAMDPAPGISAMLLQEAARRAPARRVAEASAGGAGGGLLGWLQGLFRPMAAHPALAGALTLAMVGGAAGLMYRAGKGEVAAPTSSAGSGSEPASPPAAEVAVLSPPPRGSGGAPTSYQVNLDEKNQAQEQERQGLRLEDAEKESAKGDRSRDEGGFGATNGLTDGLDRGLAPAHDAPTVPPYRASAAPMQQGSGAATGSGSAAGDDKLGYFESKDQAAPKKKAYVEIATSNEPQLKTLDADLSQGLGKSNQMADTITARSPAPVGAHAAAASGPSGGAAAGGVNDPGGTPVPTMTLPPPPMVAQTAPATGYDARQDAKLTEWARSQHGRLVALVRAGRCGEAGRLGSQISMQAPEYFAAHVENDRSIKSCKAYIDKERRKQAAEQTKSRARNSYEAPAATDAE